jgi:hypothetical protein
MPSYRACGLLLASDVAIPSLVACDPVAKPDVFIELGAGEPWPPQRGDEALCHDADAHDAAGRQRVTRAPGGEFRFAYGDGVEFLVSADGNRVRGHWPEHMTLEDAGEYLLGPILAFVLRRRGVICLHAAAVAAGDGCFAVIAPAGHGKSTTAAACAKRGWPIVTEDLLALRPRPGSCLAVPSYPRVRLWPDAVHGVFGAADALPRITPENPDWDKRYLDLTGDGYRFAREPLPLRVVYTHERDATDAPSFETLPPSEALVVLLANVYTRWQPERGQRAEEFDLLQELARTVPVKRYRGPYGLEHVDGNVAALYEDCRAVTAGPRA